MSCFIFNLFLSASSFKTWVNRSLFSFKYNFEIYWKFVRFKYLTVIIINTNSKPVVTKNERYFGGKAKNYRKVILNEIENLKNDDIQITAIVADKQRAQKAAFSQEKVNSILRNSSKQFIKGISFVPCLCHTLILAINDMTSFYQFNSMVRDIKIFHKLWGRETFEIVFIALAKSYQGRGS